MPVVVGQSKTLCRKFGLKRIEADVLALVDTGATDTSISDRLADSLGLKVIDRGRVNTAGGTHASNVFSIDVLLRNLVDFINIRAMTFTKASQAFDIIVGMDILALGDLAITNHNHQTVLSFSVPPDTKHIDFVSTADKEE
jgi:predicted aspartyl protease